MRHKDLSTSSPDEPGHSAGPLAKVTPGLVSRRPRGRPRGAKTRVLRHAGALGMHHFAFLRSWFLRLDLRDAWQRYMAFSDLSSDLRHIEHRRSELLGQVLAAGRQLDRSLPAERRITAQLDLLAQAPWAKASTALPSLDEFIDAQGLDREFYSEAELLQEYRDHHHLDTVPESPADGSAAPPTLDQVQALHQVEALLARPPEATDPLTLWLSPALAALLNRAGIGTLGALADTVRVYGSAWFRRAPGLGPTRARTLVDWLVPVSERFDSPIPGHALQATPRQRALRDGTPRGLVMPPRFGIVPLECLAVPVALAGGPARAVDPSIGGHQRGQESPGARNDLEALQGWLATHGTSTATRRAYGKEVERFYLWCLQVRGKALASIDARDCSAYRAFLADLPPAWINPAPALRVDPAWRPFRGPLSTGSQAYAVGVVRALFDGLCAAQYLAGNPMRAIRDAQPPPAGRPAPERAFTDDEWAFVTGQLDALAAHRAAQGHGRWRAETLRLRLLLAMLAGTGLRLSEMAGATMDALTDAPSSGGPSGALGSRTTAQVLRVTGRDGQVRDVPVDGSVLALIHEHQRDAAAIAALPSPAPIICTLGEPPPRWADLPNGSAVLSERRPPAVRALGSAGIYRTLKRFFRHIGQNAHGVDGLSRPRIEAASTQWLRHTFARQGVAAGLPVERLMQLLGHASLQSTGRYLSGPDAGELAGLMNAKAPIRG